jgi:hypothetical protein
MPVSHVSYCNRNAQLNFTDKIPDMPEGSLLARINGTYENNKGGGRKRRKQQNFAPEESNAQERSGTQHEITNALDYSTHQKEINQEIGGGEYIDVTGEGSPDPGESGMPLAA